MKERRKKERIDKRLRSNDKKKKKITIRDGNKRARGGKDEDPPVINCIGRIEIATTDSAKIAWSVLPFVTANDTLR